MIFSPLVQNIQAMLRVVGTVCTTPRAFFLDIRETPHVEQVGQTRQPYSAGNREAKG